MNERTIDGGRKEGRDTELVLLLVYISVTESVLTVG